MSDEMNNPVPPVEPEPTPAEASSAWRDVLAEFDALGEAIARWAKSAVSDPENQRRLSELSDRLENLVGDVGASIKGAAEGDVGQSFREAADKTGEAFKLAGQRFGEEVGPRLASTFRTVGEKLRGAAERMDERGAAEKAAAEATAEPEPPAEPDKPSGPSA